MALAQKARGLPAFPPALTDRVVQRRGWRPSGGEAVTTACQDAHIQHGLSVPVPYLPEHAADIIGRSAAEQWSSGKRMFVLTFVVVLGDVSPAFRWPRWSPS